MTDEQKNFFVDWIESWKSRKSISEAFEIVESLYSVLTEDEGEEE